MTALLSATRFWISMACSESFSECLEMHTKTMSHSLFFCRFAEGVAFQAEVSTSKPLEVNLWVMKRKFTQRSGWKKWKEFWIKFIYVICGFLHSQRYYSSIFFLLTWTFSKTFFLNLHGQIIDTITQEHKYLYSVKMMLALRPSLLVWDTYTYMGRSLIRGVPILVPVTEQIRSIWSAMTVNLIKKPTFFLLNYMYSEIADI